MSRRTAESRQRAKDRAQARTHCRYFAYCGNALKTHAERHCGTCRSCQEPSEDPLDEIIRIDALLDAELRGIALPKCSANARRRLAGREFWPVAPLRKFHDELVARASGTNAPYEVAASRFGTTSRTMYRHLTEKEIALDTLERLLVRAGIPLSTMYPEGRDTKVEETEVVVDERCRTPGCSAWRVPDERFCPEHLALLWLIREEERERARQVKAKIGRDSHPLCCSPHCQNERTPPEAFCDDCQEAGMVEEVEDV